MDESLAFNETCSGTKFQVEHGQNVKIHLSIKNRKKEPHAEEPEERTPRPNLSKNEVRALQELGKSKNLVIKKADKGSCIVVQDRSTYAAEGRAHLADTSNVGQFAMLLG